MIMKKLLFLVAIFACYHLCFYYLKKELSCEGYKDNNKPPLANAGAHQTITLPKDSVMIDGCASTDPNSTITSYKWAKIAGPVSSGNTSSNSS